MEPTAQGTTAAVRFGSVYPQEKWYRIPPKDRKRAKKLVASTVGIKEFRIKNAPGWIHGTQERYQVKVTGQAKRKLNALIGKIKRRYFKMAPTWNEISPNYFRLMGMLTEKIAALPYKGKINAPIIRDHSKELAHILAEVESAFKADTQAR